MSQPPDEDPVERELRWVREAAAKRAKREVSPLSKPVKRIRFLTLLKWAALILCAPLTLLLAIIVSPVLWPEPVGGQLEPTLWNACIEKSDLGHASGIAAKSLALVMKPTSFRYRSKGRRWSGLGFRLKTPSPVTAIF